MCDTCPCNSTSSIPGPADVASGVLGAAVGAALTKPGRRVMFWGVAVPMLPFAVWGVFGWWTIAIVALAAALTGVGVAYARILHRHALVVAPPSLQHRVALPAAQHRPIALPRNLAITRKRRALPVPAKALPAVVVTGKVIPAPGRSWPIASVQSAEEAEKL